MRIIAGSLRGRTLVAPQTDKTRPTTDRVRESIFNLLHHQMRALGIELEDLEVLDVFAGSGALGLEALSRGAKSALFIDYYSDALSALRENIAHLKIQDQARVFKCNALKPPKARQSYGLIFLDPPYGKGYIKRSIKALERLNWFNEDALFVCELGVDDPFDCSLDVLVEKVYGNTKVIIACAAPI